MANLRTNNLSGEQGQNAYRGSVFFDGRDDVTVLQVIAADSNDDFTFGTGDFTIEFWVLQSVRNSTASLYGGRRDADNEVAPVIYLNNGVVYYYTAGSNRITGSSTLVVNSWNHVAVSRASGSTKLFVNGVQEGSTYSDSNSYIAKLNRPTIGAEGRIFANNPLNGYLSNVRVVKGTALYTGTFTPPQSELTVVDGTVLLCCQDSDNTLQEATGKELLGQGGVYHGRRFSNLAVNGNLENGDTTNWVNGGLGTFEVSTDHPHSGSYSLHCISNSNGDACAYVIPVTLDTTKRYRISAYIKVVGPGGTSARAKMKIGSGTGGNENYESRTAGQGYSGLGNWTYVEWIGLATSDTTHVTFNESSANNVNDYYVDDLRIELWYPEEGENILANPNFYSTATGWSFSSTPSGEYSIGSNKLSVADNSRTSDAFATQQLFSSSIAEGKYRATINYALSSGDFDLGIGNNRIFGVAGGGTYGGEGNTATATFEITAGSTNSNLRIVANQHCVGDFFNIHLTRVAEPKAPKVIPPYGVDAGNTFGGTIQQSTENFMCFPTGRTEEKGRGRAVAWLGADSPNYTKQIDYFDIQSTGTTTKFGEISDTVGLGAAMSSTTRGVFAGGTKPGVGNVNLLEFITIATTGNAIDFGGVSTTFRYGGGISNSTRGLICGAYQGGGASGTKNVIQFITIATLGDTADFGDIIANSNNGIFGAGTCSSSTRGITAGGGTGPSQVNEINHITIGTLGNSVDFGDLSAARYYVQGLSSSTRGVFAAGYQESPGFTSSNLIEFITIASTGDAVDFGDLITAARLPGSSGGSNKIRGVFVGAGVHPSYYNTIEFVTIATTGNASDFGDISTSGGTPYGSVAVSDSHGGLS